MKYLILLYLLTGCATTERIVDSQPEAKKPPVTHLNIPKTKYRVGQCFNVVDYVDGRGDKRDIIKIDSITETSYIYRWRVNKKEWAIDTNQGIGKFELFEKMVKEIKCPDLKE